MYQDMYVEQSVHRYVPTVTKVLNVLLIIATIFVAFQFVFVNYAVFGTVSYTHLRAHET